MSSTGFIKASELSDDVRSAIESLLGRRLQSDESITVDAVKHKPAPTGEERAAAFDRWQILAESMRAQSGNLTEDEIDEFIEEALRAARG
jgi:hypothetical protein